MLNIQNLSKVYESSGKTVEAVRDLTLPIKEKEFIALVGPSGCGKTTLLKMIAGLCSPTSGKVILDGNLVSSPDKNLGLVSQSSTLFPWLTVRENIAFGLDLKKISKNEQKHLINYFLNVTNLTDFSEFYPKDLSGGMQQRAAIARTLANDPKVLLMDEPFGALDSQTRSQMQEFLIKLWEAEKKTVIFITHDVSEAVFLADTVYVLTKRPMEIKRVYRVPFLRPRIHELKKSTEFFNFCNKVVEDLEN